MPTIKENPSTKKMLKMTEATRPCSTELEGVGIGVGPGVGPGPGVVVVFSWQAHKVHMIF